MKTVYYVTTKCRSIYLMPDDKYEIIKTATSPYLFKEMLMKRGHCVGYGGDPVFCPPGADIMFIEEYATTIKEEKNKKKEKK